MGIAKSRAEPLRVGVDMHVVDGAYQGSRTYMLEVFSRVIQRCPNIKFFIFCNDISRLLDDFPVFSNDNVVLVSGISKSPIRRLALQFPYLQLKYRLHYFHAQYIFPIFMFCRGVLVLHDILFESHPKYFSKKFVLRSIILCRWSALRATRIFTISSFSRDEILKRYNVAPEKIQMIHAGVSTEKFRESTDGYNHIKKFGVSSKRYLLSVGRLDIRKNMVNLVLAYSQTATEYPLVIVGQDGSGSRPLDKIIQEMGVGNKVFVIKDVGDSELTALYRHATCFIFPSFAEGFGLPVLEAMSSGTPVITSNTSSLVEAAGDAAILIDPNSVEEIRKGIQTILNSGEIAKSLVKKGHRHVKNFSWELTAQRVSKFYLKRKIS